MQKKAYVEQKGPIIHTTTLFGREHPYFPTIGCCFAYDSINIFNIGKQLVEINREKAIPLEHRLDTICVLKQGVLTNWTAEKQQLSLTPEPDSRIVAIPANEGLLLFYLLLMSVLNQTWMPPIQLAGYAKAANFGPAIYCDLLSASQGDD